MSLHNMDWDRGVRQALRSASWQLERYVHTRAVGYRHQTGQAAFQHRSNDCAKFTGELPEPWRNFHRETA
jgi:hypothetical protein